MAETLPAFVIGVGQAGIAAMNSIAEVVEENNDEDAFGFLAIDTDTGMLNQAPASATTQRLKTSDKFETEDQSQYPFLTREMQIGGKGALRQRPVGRYKLDSRGIEDFNSIFQSVFRTVREHARNVDYSFDQQSDSYNIFLVHSLGGGTGSGTYPLLSASLARISERLGNALGTDIYVAGMGVTPEVQFTAGPIEPPGDPLYYPNAFGALNDLSKLLSIDEEGGRSIPIYSQALSAGAGSQVGAGGGATFEANDLPIEQTPYDNYWLVGVDEEQITGDATTARYETYREQVNRTMAEAIYSLSRLEGSAENWATNVSGLPELGTVSHSEVRVPHEEVSEFCQMQEQIRQKRAFVSEDDTDADESIYAEINSLEQQRDRLTEIKRTPEKAVELLENGAELETTVRGRLESDLGGGETLVSSHSGEDVEAVFQAIEQEYDTATLLLATYIFKDLLDDPSAAPRVESHWSELVSQQWRNYNMVDRTKYGGTSISTLEGKAEQLSNFYSDKLDEYEADLEDVEAQMDAWETAKDIVPASLGILQSRKQRLEQSQKTVRKARDRLLDAQGRYERVQSMREARGTYRRRAREQLDKQVAAIGTRVTEKQEQIEETKQEIERLERDIKSLRESLTREKTAKRVGVLPIREEKVDELDPDRLEELQSFHDYVDQKFVDERRVRNGLTNWVQKAYAWNEPVFRMNVADSPGSGNQQRRPEIWVLCAETNMQYPKDMIDVSLEGEQKWAGESELGYLEDPYTITFVSYYNDEPVEALTLYQKLEQMAEEGALDDMTGKFGDHRLAFAYPEWYGRDIQKAFKIEAEVTLPRPPELAVESVLKGDLSEGEKRNHIKTSGIDSYVWQGAMWEAYQAEEDLGFNGWEDHLSQVTWRALQQATPEPDLKSRWLADQADWGELLEAYRQNLLDQEGIDVTFESQE
jgi:hypothetical protein